MVLDVREVIGSGRNVQAPAPRLDVDMAMAILDYGRVVFGEKRAQERGLLARFERLLIAASQAHHANAALDLSGAPK